jgi:hypothetical protein
LPKYTVNHAYRSFSDGVQYGPYEAGTVVELAETHAEWVNRDSPGCLTEAAKPTKPKAEEPERQAAATPNRQHKGGRNRAGG